MPIKLCFRVGGKSEFFQSVFGIGSKTLFMFGRGKTKGIFVNTTCAQVLAKMACLTYLEKAENTAKIGVSTSTGANR